MIANQARKSITNNLDNKINLIFSHWMSRYILDLKKNIENNFFIKLLELFKSKNFIFKIKKYSKLFFTLSRPGMLTLLAHMRKKKTSTVKI